MQGQLRSEAIDQGAYYEVTHGRILGDTLYAGSLYFSKDCLAAVKDPGMDLKEHTVSIGNYLTKINETIGSQLGLCSGGLALWGEFQMDSSGLIISYAEYRLP